MKCGFILAGDISVVTEARNRATAEMWKRHGVYINGREHTHERTPAGGKKHLLRQYSLRIRNPWRAHLSLVYTFNKWNRDYRNLIDVQERHVTNENVADINCGRSIYQIDCEGVDIVNIGAFHPLNFLLERLEVALVPNLTIRPILSLRNNAKILFELCATSKFLYCTDYETTDKRNFPTFARTRPPDNQISKSVAAVLLAFNWTQVTFFYFNSEDNELSKIASTILSVLEGAGVTVLFTRTWGPFPYHHGYSDNPFHSLVQQTYLDSRMTPRTVTTITLSRVMRLQHVLPSFLLEYEDKAVV
ncbi:hypothetical protein J6590_074377 [Homalodisca vitripennis]|nr:hypothetical protein J6590_074377 [Homalodisca vitripennis]